MQDNKQSRAVINQPLADYRAAPYRMPTFAGRGYPADANELCQYLDYYLSVGVEQFGSEKFDGEQSLPHGGALRGLLSPHIDYPRGGAVYGAVWQQAAAALEDVDLVVMFGTDHYGNDPFTLTRQNYATPYGILPTATDVVDKLALAIDGVNGGGSAYRGELRHCNEHSLELVAVWLHHMLEKQGASNGSAPCELVPILCGGLHRHIYNHTDPADDQLLNSVLTVLHEISKERNVLVVASGDLAHVGPAFSGTPLDAHKRMLLRKADDALLTSMDGGNEHAFFEEIRSVADQNNVCGVTPIYLTMRLLAALNRDEAGASKLSGDVIAYDTCPADNMDTSVVTIGGVLFS